MAIHINSESPRYDFEILYPPITRVFPHTGKDLPGIRHLLNGTEYGTMWQCVAVLMWDIGRWAASQLAVSRQTHHLTAPGMAGRPKSATPTTQPSGRVQLLQSSYTGCKDMEMQLNEREASLVDAFRRLPPDAATELSALAERLAELAPNRRIDWSDSWSDEDLNEFRAASLRRLDAEESEDQG